jgi:hypothetical protein
MFSMCKVLYTSPESWRYGTIDGTIFQKKRKMPNRAFLYSIVYSDKKVSEIHVHPCASMDITFTQLREKMIEMAKRVPEPVELMCVEKLSDEEMYEAVKKDFENATDDFETVFQILEGCFPE